MLWLISMGGTGRLVFCDTGREVRSHARSGRFDVRMAVDKNSIADLLNALLQLQAEQVSARDKTDVASVFKSMILRQVESVRRQLFARLTLKDPSQFPADVVGIRKTVVEAAHTKDGYDICAVPR